MFRLFQILKNWEEKFVHKEIRVKLPLHFEEVRENYLPLTTFKVSIVFMTEIY